VLPWSGTAWIPTNFVIDLSIIRIGPVACSYVGNGLPRWYVALGPHPFGEIFGWSHQKQRRQTFPRLHKSYRSRIGVGLRSHGCTRSSAPRVPGGFIEPTWDRSILGSSCPNAVLKLHPQIGLRYIGLWARVGHPTRALGCLDCMQNEINVLSGCHARAG